MYYNYDFDLRADGLYRVDEKSEEWLCNKVEVLAVLSDANTKEESVILQVGESKNTIEIKKADLTKNTLLREVNKIGADLMENNAQFLNEYVFRIMRKKHKVIAHRKLGYADIDNLTAYYLQESISGDGKQNTSLYNGDKAVMPTGDKTEWDSLYNSHFRECPYLQLLVSLGVIAPLVTKLKSVSNTENVIISLVGSSSTGKTTALKLMTSMWGLADMSKNGLMSSFNATQTASRTLLADKIGFPAFIDESASSQKDWQNYLYEAAMGVEKERATQDGQLRERRNWSTAILITSECSMLQNVENDGAKVRLLEVPFKFFDSAKTADEVIEVISRSYGHYGNLFVKAMFQYSDSVLESYYKKAKQVFENKIDCKGNGLKSRRLNMLAIILVAGYLLKKAHLLNVSVKKLTGQLIELEKLASTNLLNKEDEALEALRSDLSQNWSRIIKPVNSPSGKNTLSKPINPIGKISKNNVVLADNYIDDCLKRNGFDKDKKVIYSKWNTAGITIHNDNNRNNTKRDVNGVSIRVKVFDYEILTGNSINEEKSVANLKGRIGKSMLDD